MVKVTDPIAVQMVPISQITVLNPRVRSKATFQALVDSIAKVGLKRPITVNRCRQTNGKPAYEVVCGQGRLEAYISLGQAEIPAVVVDVSEEDRLLRSVVENVARRQHRPLELLHDIGELKKRGYSDAEIATKTGLSNQYVHAIRHLLDEGEERLLVAVETGQIPLSIALEIASADPNGAQDALAKAYEQGLLRGKRLLAAKRVIEQRQRRGKAHRPMPSRRGGQRMTSEKLVREYQKEADRQRLLIKRAEVTQSRLLFVIAAMRSLLADENFVTLLRAEGLETMPRPLAELIIAREA